MCHVSEKQPHLFPPMKRHGFHRTLETTVVFWLKNANRKTREKPFTFFRAFRVPTKKGWQKLNITFFFHRKKTHSLAVPFFFVVDGCLAHPAPNIWNSRNFSAPFLVSGRAVWCSTYLLNLATPPWCWWPRKVLGRAPLKSEEQKTLAFLNWVVVSTIFLFTGSCCDTQPVRKRETIFYFHPYLGKIPILTIIFFKGVVQPPTSKVLPSEINMKMWM